jgi:hypothetical protein
VTRSARPLYHGLAGRTSRRNAPPATSAHAPHVSAATVRDLVRSTVLLIGVVWLIVVFLPIVLDLASRVAS